MTGQEIRLLWRIEEPLPESESVIYHEPRTVPPKADLA